MSFPRYPSYKDSGVEWLGEVPGHWETIPLSRAATGTDSLFIDGDWIESKDLSDDGIRYLTSGNVGKGYYKEQGQGYISEETFTALNCIEVLPGDVLISRLNLPIGRSCLVPGLGSRIVTCVDNVIVRPDPDFDRRFFVYQLTSKSHFANMENLARGTTMQRISRSTLGRVRFAFPPLAEQTQIAAFLDRETAKIDELVAEQRRLMELLKEKRQAVISHAVTQGLNPHAPMKPSGIEWLGDVPEHWELTKLSRLTTKIGDGLHGTPEYVDESPFRFINGNNLIDGAITLTETTRSVSQSEFEKHSVDLDRTSVLLSINGTIGNLALFRGELVMLGKSAAYVNCGEKLKRESLCFYLKSSFISRYFEHSVTGTTIFNLSLYSVRRLPMVLPPINEQETIIAYLDTESAKFDTLTAEAQRAIDLLLERRIALISAAVTGQIDVRKIV